MPTITINVAARGSRLKEGGTSSVGHMWVELRRRAEDKKSSHGFAPKKTHHRKPFAPGDFYRNDSENYLDIAYSVSFEVTDKQFDAVETFVEDPTGAGFSQFYNGLDNSCIDFVWKALEQGGLNPRNFQGVFWPTFNIDDLKRIGDRYNPPGSIFSSYPSPPLPWPGGEFTSIRDGAGGTGRGFGSFRGIGHAAGRTAGGNGHVDPLAFDLNGDGVKTSSIASAASILFDHDADGIKTGTGWIRPEDGWLVLDRDGNGSIDSGRELFGADTVKSNGRMATNGLDALADFDKNSDGKIDAADEVFANLRIWRDLNQDGVSQANELSTLGANNIATISTVLTKSGKNIGNGNIQTGTGTFTRPDGSAGMTANLNLLDNTFYREFTDPVTLTDQARALPTLSGSGKVRDLDEAISLSSDLGDWVARYARQTTRQEQVGMLDSFIEKWADTSSFKSLKAQTEALSNKGVRLTYVLTGMTAGTADFDDFIRKLGVVERFMGFTFGGKNGQQKYELLNAKSGKRTVTMSADLMATVLLTYDRFKSDIYESLVAETRLQAYSTLLLKDSQSESRFTSLESAFRQAIAADPQNGIVDLIEFISAVGETRLARVGWASMDFLVTQLNGAPELQAFSEELSSWTVRFADPAQHSLAGTTRSDLMVGTLGADTLTGGDGDDVLIARSGADIINGGKGDDYIDGGDGDDTITDTEGANTLRGGRGNDIIRGCGIMEGGAGDDMFFSDGFTGDTYLFNLGDGKDIVSDFGVTPQMGKTGPRFDDTLRFGAGITSSSVMLARSGNDMIFRVSATDQVTVKDWYKDSYHYIEQVQFADGVTWDLVQISGMPVRINSAPETKAARSESGGSGGSGGSGDAIDIEVRSDIRTAGTGMHLIENQIDALVSAMAAFAPPAAGQSAFAAQYQTAVSPLIAAHCQ